MKNRIKMQNILLKTYEIFKRMFLQLFKAKIIWFGKIFSEIEPLSCFFDFWLKNRVTMILSRK